MGGSGLNSVSSINGAHHMSLMHRIAGVVANPLILLAVVTVLPCDIGSGSLRADTVLLKNGRRLKGKVLRRPTDASDTYVIQFGPGRRVRLDAKEVGRIDKSTRVEERYAMLLPDMPDTAKGHYAMARWCHENELKARKQLHLEHVIRHDPDHTEARKMLGHSMIRGKWGLAQDHMEAQGYERHRGSLRLPQQIALAKRKNEVELAQKKWRKDIRQWRKDWNRGGQRAELSRQRITSIHDPMAAPGLHDLVSSEGDPRVREMYVDALSKLKGGDATSALIHVALNDGDTEVRLRSIKYLGQRGSVHSLDAFIQSLRSKDNLTIRRAGVALGRLGDTNAVLPLIDALVTTHEYMVKPKANIRPSFGGSADGSSGFNGLGVGGGPRKVSRQLENKTVLDALVSLTGKNYRYSESDWKRWYIQQRALPADISLRRGQ